MLPSDLFTCCVTIAMSLYYMEADVYVAGIRVVLRDGYNEHPGIRESGEGHGSTTRGS